MAAHPGTSFSVPSLPPPCPKSPPQYPDLYGKRQEMAKVQVLEREIDFLEEELQTVEGLYPASRCCKEVADFVVAKSDPLIPANQKNQWSCRFWKWLCGTSSFNFSWLSWICCSCHSKCSIHVELPRCCDSCDCSLCNCHPCTCCSIPKCWWCCSCPRPCPQSSCCDSCDCSLCNCHPCTFCSIPKCWWCCSCPRPCPRSSCCDSCDCSLCNCHPCSCCSIPKSWWCCSCPRSYPRSRCCRKISCSRDSCSFRFPSCPDCSCCQWTCPRPRPKCPKLRLCCSCRKNCCTCNPCCLFL